MIRSLIRILMLVSVVIVGALGPATVLQAKPNNQRPPQTEPSVGRAVRSEGPLDSGSELRSPQVLRLVEDLPKTHLHGASLDVAVDRPQLADVPLLLRGQGRSWRPSRWLDGRQW